MLVGNPLPGIQEYRPIVRVNGVVRDIESVSWGTEMSGDLPDQVIATGGIGGAKGTITWAPQSAVQSRPVSPWAKVADWPPSSGDLVQVQVTDGVTTWTRFTGVIDRTTGGPTGYQSTIQDFRDRVTGKVTHQALLRYMPPYQGGGEYRRIGLTNQWVLTTALRASGIYNTPPIESLSMMSMPLQGSVWPEYGDLSNAEGLNGAAHAQFITSPWGYSAANFTATVIPNSSRAVDSSAPLQLSMLRAPDHADTAELSAIFAGTRVRLRIDGAGLVNAQWVNSAGTTTTVVQLTGNQIGDSEAVSLLIKGNTWELRSSNGATASASQSRTSGLTLSSMIVTASAGARIAGVQVSSPTSATQEHRSTRFVRDMTFTYPGIGSEMSMSPALRDRSVPDLVNEVTRAVLIATWWDETGVLRLVPSNQLRGLEPMAELSTTDDITAIAWEDSLLAVRSKVEVTWKSALITKSREARLELWRARTDTLVQGADTIEDFVTPEPGVEWFGVDRTLGRLNDSNWGAYNLRRGSYCGIWLSNSAGDPDPRSANVTITSENLYADSMKITTTAISVPSGLEANTETHPEAIALKAYLRGQSLPVVRGRGRAEWVDDMYSVSTGSGRGSVLSHDVGYWGHTYDAGGTVASRIGDWIAGQVAAPQPTITDMGVIYDPRRQLGDVYTIKSDWLGIELRVLVVGLTEDHGDGSHQSLTVRVIKATNTRGVTYDDLEAAWTGGNYTSLNAAWSALNYAALEANPLEGAPS